MSYAHALRSVTLAAFASVLVVGCGPVPNDSGPGAGKAREKRSGGDAKGTPTAGVERLASGEEPREDEPKASGSEIFIEDETTTVGGNDDERDDDVDSEEAFTGERAVLTVVGLRLDDDDDPQMLRLTRKDGKVFELQWPTKDAVVKLEGACDLQKVEFAVEVSYEGETYTPSQANCFIGKSQGKSGRFMGFEGDCSGGDYKSIDDAILVVACSQSEIELTGVNLDESIDLEDWRDD